MWKIACAALLLFRNPGRHHLGMPGRLRRNPQLKGKSVMRTLLASAGLALLLALATEPSASAQEAPEYLKQTLPDHLLKPHWDEQLAVMNPKGALDGKTKQLIALGVAAQIPCVYCVYGHTKLAKAAGATDAEIKEAIATAALVRFNSTMLQGSGYDLQKFQQEVDRMSAPK